MEITIQSRAQWNSHQGIVHSSILKAWLARLDKQQESKTLWYIVSLITQSVLFLPVPAAMIYYFNAPLFLLPITLVLFFANIIAAMGGAGVRIILLLFLTSAIIHILMLSVYLL
jgi:hypothetical protein